MRHLAAVSVLLLASLASAQSPFMEDCGLEKPGAPVLPPVPPKAYEPSANEPRGHVLRELPERAIVGGVPSARLVATGALSGKTVYLNAGHGFTWTSGTSRFSWITQRSTTNDIVEDLVSEESVSQWIIPMLMGAGARVVPIREADLNPAMVIVDNGDPGYAEMGAGFSTSVAMAFSTPAFPMSGDLNPFTTGTNRLMAAAPTATASATYTLNVPSSGNYNVYVSYAAFSLRVPDAHYAVTHSGGTTHFRVNQRRAGGTWALLGNFHFRASTPAVVTVFNDSALAPTGNISLDAVRLGGGMGVIDRGGGVSGRPRAEESSRYATQFNGAPAAVYAPSSNTAAADRNNDISARARFTAWMNEPGDDAVYVSWHTNAVNNAARGTEVYAYGSLDVNTCQLATNYAGVTGSKELAIAIHDELIKDFRSPLAGNEPTWRDRSTRCANFGELNPVSNNETPATLLELAFHDQVDDANRLKDPQFRYIAARAIVQGILTYYAGRDGGVAVFPPDPPTHPSAVNSGAGVVLRWHAPSTDSQGVLGGAATSYRVYTSTDGLGWDDGVPTGGTTFVTALAPNEARYFRFTAVNAGGESLPSSTVGVRAPNPGKPFALIINAYDRAEASLGQFEDLSAYTLGMVQRTFLRRMNDGNNVSQAGDSFAANDVGFDSVSIEALNAGEVPLEPYALVGWLGGRGHAGGAAPNASEQALLSGLLTRGGRLIFSGPILGAPSLASLLGVTAGTGSATRVFTGAGLFSGLGPLTLDDGRGGSYDVGRPEAIGAQGMGVALGSLGPAGAAVLVPQKSAALSFPFEGITAAATRTEMIRRLLMEFAPQPFDGGLAEVDAGQVIPFDAGVDVDAGTPALDGGSMQGSDAGVEVTDGGTEPLAPIVVPALTSPTKLGEVKGCGCTTGSAQLMGLLGLALIWRKRRSAVR